MLCASGQQFADWSAAYRLFERERFNIDVLFDPIRREMVERLKPGEPLVVAMDDTLIRKRGRKVSGAGWRRDPLGPHFCTNFVWGQRFLQLSAALPETGQIGRARAIPIDLMHAPSPVKPGKNASDEQLTEYRQKQKLMKISCVGARRIAELRAMMDKENKENIRLIVAVDGGFANRAVLRNLPHDTVVIGRIRKDARLFHLPTNKTGTTRGRRRWYGAPLPTPEEIRQDELIPWVTVEAFAAGKTHSFQIKTLESVRWAVTGQMNVRLVVIRPLAYRLQKGSKLLYRDPAYLICTDPDLPLDRLIQSYLWRWEIELNFRDEKTVLGAGEAQVRTSAAVEMVPALIIAAYAFLLLAGTANREELQTLPQPKWRKPTPAPRTSTSQFISIFRSELWGKAMGVNLKHFADCTKEKTNRVFFEKSLPSAVCYAVK